MFGLSDPYWPNPYGNNDSRVHHEIRHRADEAVQLAQNLALDPSASLSEEARRAIARRQMNIMK